MHETGVCRNIVETVERFAQLHGARTVRRVHIVLGEIHDVVPDILCGAFAWMARGTVAEGAELVIDRVPFSVKCQDCGCVYRLDGNDRSTWPCHECGSMNYRLYTGREFTIDAIEIEVGDRETVAC